MAQIEINSFFTNSGIPAIDIDNNNPISGINYPLVRIWEVTGSVYTLIVGNVAGTGQNTDGMMVPVTTVGIEDGFYSFLFTDTIGYDETKNYLVRSDGGPSIVPQDRYQVAAIDPSSTIDVDAIADAVWDEPATDHLAVGSTGLVLSQTKANTDQLFLDVASVQAIVDITLKYHTNRTKVSPSTNELVIYDDDCTTILRKFTLYNAAGVPSVDEICERKPNLATDGQPVCP